MTTEELLKRLRTSQGGLSEAEQQRIREVSSAPPQPTEAKRRTEQVLQTLGMMARGAAGSDTSRNLARLKELAGVTPEEQASIDAATGQSAGMAAQAASGSARSNAEAARTAAATGQAAGMSAQTAGRGAEAARMAASTTPYGYGYNPKAIAAGAPEGQRYGFTTDELKRTPMGRAFVGRDPATGYETVDTPGLTMANTAAIGQLVRQREAEEQRGRKTLTGIRQQKADADFSRALMSKQAATKRLQQLAGSDEEERRRRMVY